MQTWTDEALRALLCGELERQAPLRRKQLIERCAEELGEQVKSEEDLRPGSEAVRGKSRLGMLLTELLHSGVITEDAVGYLRPAPGQTCSVSPARVREFVLETLREGPAGKQALYQKAERAFGTDRTPGREDDNALRSVVGRVLPELAREGHVVKTSRGYYRLPGRDGYPGTELGSWLRRAADGGDLQTCFLEAVHTKGGEWFEGYCVSLLRRYYQLTGKLVDEGSVTGGSDDGGIDGVIHTQDDLGYRETVLMQMKNRHAVMCSKDVREFYGAVCAENGSRGIFITLSSFHPEAQKLLDKVDNLTGVDGEKLFAIARRCRLGLIEKDGALCIDEELLLNT